MQGHFQVVLSRQHCPLLQRKLGWFDRVLYCSGVYSYVVGAITTPTFILIPILTVWVGIFPIVVSNWAAVGLTVRAGRTVCHSGWAHAVAGFCGHTVPFG